MTGTDVWQWMQWYQHHAPWVLGSGAVGLLGLKAWQLHHRKNWQTSDAHWAVTTELRDAQLLHPHGIVLGRYGRWTLRYGGPGHVLVIASPRKGKTTSLVIPTLLEPLPHTSVLVNDPKGELLACTGKYRSTVSKIIELNPCSRSSHQRNPLDSIRLDTDYEFADTQLLSETLANPNGEEPRNETERHFFELTSDMLNGYILYGLRSGRGLCLGALAELLALTPAATLHQEMRTDSHPIIQGMLHTIDDMDDRAYGNIRTDIERALRLFKDPVIARMTERSDFQPEELRHGVQPLSVYLSVPFTHMTRTRALVRVLMRQCLTSAMESVHGHDFALDVIAEEFPSLGHMHIISESMNQAAGYGVRFLLITPSFENIVHTYGPHHNFLTGTDVQVYFGLTDGITAERVATRIGKHTEMRKRVTYYGGRRSVSREEVEKPLLSADSILHLKQGRVIVVAGNTQVQVRQMPWYKTQPWKSRGVNGV